jgi:hypothetical protein
MDGYEGSARLEQAGGGIFVTVCRVKGEPDKRTCFRDLRALAIKLN